MIMHRQELIALLCILIAGCMTLSGYANITSVECPGEYRQTGCKFNNPITIHGSNFATYSVIELNKEFDIELNLEGHIFDQSVNGYLTSNYYNDVPQGPHLIEIPQQRRSNETNTIIINIGTFYGQDLIPTFFSATPENTTYVNDQSSSEIWTHIEFNITGKFEQSELYRVLFYSTTPVQDEIMPACIRIKVSEDALTCTLGDVDVNNFKYSFLVQRISDKYLLSVTKTLWLLTPVEVPTTSTTTTTTTTTKKPVPIPSDYPVVVNATSNCVSNSAACKDGESITFTGEQFMDGLTSNYFVNIDGIDRARCAVRQVSLESLRCELTGINGKKGVYLMTIQQRNANGNWSSHKIFAGSLILGKEDGSSGWTISYLEPTNSRTSNSVKSTSATVTKVLTIIFAILLAVFIIVMIVMCAKCKFIDRKTWNKIKTVSHSPNQYEMSADMLCIARD